VPESKPKPPEPRRRQTTTKGDWSRVSDWERYRRTMDRIFPRKQKNRSIREEKA